MEEYQNYYLLLEENKVETPIKIKQKFNKRLSPLRYPGGKSKFIPYLYNKMDHNKSIFVEPFCGGSSVGLSLLDAGVIKKLILNDLDYGVYSLFHTICNNPRLLIEKISEYVPTRKSFFQLRNLIQTDYKNCSEEDAAFALLIVNRLAFSGICKANPKGNLTERYNPEQLIKRIQKISSLRDNITVLNYMANDVILEYYWDPDITLFVDPPYYEKGKQLYNKYFTDKDHIELAYYINGLFCGYPGAADIFLTYDNDEYIKNIYQPSTQVIVGRNYSIAN